MCPSFFSISAKHLYIGGCFQKMKMRQSKLFGEKELLLLKKRIEGDKKDPTGLWSRKVKPKVLEMVNEWMPRRRELRKIVSELRESQRDETFGK